MQLYFYFACENLVISLVALCDEHIRTANSKTPLQLICGSLTSHTWAPALTCAANRCLRRRLGRHREPLNPTCQEAEPELHARRN